jgi:hypothetical protein
MCPRAHSSGRNGIFYRQSVEPATRRIAYRLHRLYHHCEYTVCSGTYWPDFRSVLYTPSGVSFEGVTSYSPAEQIGTVPTWSLSSWYCTLPSAVAVAMSLRCVAVWWGGLLTNAFTTENRPTCITSTVSAMEIVGLLLWNVVPDSVAGTAIRFGMDCPKIESWWRKDLPHSSRPIISPNQPPLIWVPYLSGRTPAGRGVDDPFSSGAQVKERI